MRKKRAFALGDSGGDLGAFGPGLWLEKASLQGLSIDHGLSQDSSSGRRGEGDTGSSWRSSSSRTVLYLSQSLTVCMADFDTVVIGVKMQFNRVNFFPLTLCHRLFP